MELTRVGTPNTMLRRVREISGAMFRQRGEKEKDSRENVVAKRCLGSTSSLLDERNEGSLLSAMKFRARFATRGKFSRGRV